MASKKILFLASFPPRECGIATFTKDLTESVQKKFGNSLSPEIIAVNDSESSVYKYGRKVRLAINEQDLSSYEAAARRVNRMKSVEIVNVQHEFGLFGGEYGSYLLRFMELLNKKIAVTLHTVLEEPPPEMKKVVQQIFELSDRVVVMTQAAERILVSQYGIDGKKITVIPHGVPSVEFANLETARKKYGITEKNVLLTFGLLSRGKAIENAVLAMPEIVKRHPDTVYLIVGETHPRVREYEGESYRQELKALAEKNGVSRHVKFLDKFLAQREIVECLRMSTLYLAPSLDPEQIVSGTVSYAMGAGKAIISSKNKYNMEVLAGGRGIMLKKNNPKRFARTALMLLSSQEKKSALERNAFEYSRRMTWPNVATQYYNTFASLAPITNGAFSRIPRLNFGHFDALTDDFGMIQFSKYAEPDRQSGYTLDDNARALVVAAKGYEKLRTKKMLSFAGTFLAFMEKCQLQDGGFHNLLDGNREFIDDVGSEDSFGRAVRSLGVALKSGLPEDYRLRAKKMLDMAIARGHELNSPRAQADTLIGIVKSREYLPGGAEKMEGMLLDSFITKYNEVSDGEWNWFEEYLTYGNAKIPEALFEARKQDKTGAVEKIARESMDFLTRTLFIDGKLVPIGQEKWFMKSKERSMYDQQPIEAAGMSTAYLKAFESTNEPEYRQKARDSFDWFLGKNSQNQVVYDEATGGCFDGLTRNGVNANEGAESTVSYLLARLTVL